MIIIGVSIRMDKAPATYQLKSLRSVRVHTIISQLYYIITH